MSIEPAPALDEPIIHARDEGRHFHFLNHLATVKLAAGSEGSMSVVEFVGTRGFGPPLHSHLHEDELFIVMEGRLVFFSGDQSIEAETGAFAYLPQALPHTFQVLSETARFINVTASRSGVPRFDQMVSALGTAVDVPGLPEPGDIDPERVAEVCLAHGIEILGPPPAPLD